VESNWDNLRYFNALARHGTLSQAARALGVSHSTVQRHISAFEAELKTRLFLQGSSGYKLSQTGQKLYRETSAIQYTLQHISSEISGADEALQGNVSVTVSDTIGYFLLPDMLKGLRARYPNIAVSVSVANSLSNVQDHEADIAVRTGVEPANDLIGRNIGSIGFCTCVSKRYMRQHGLSAHCTVQDAEHFIQLDSSFDNSMFKQWLPRNRENCNIIHVNGFLTAYKLCSSGLGVTLLPAYILEHDKTLALIDSSQLPPDRHCLRSHSGFSYLLD